MSAEMTRDFKEMVTGKGTGIVSGAFIRRMESRDVPEVIQIQSRSGEAAQWSQLAYENSCRDTGQFALVAERDGQIAGFIVAREVAHEMEILNLAVDSAARRQGVGSALLRSTFAQALKNAATKVLLEVRASNTVAQRFYQAHGFVSTGIRPNYYREPLEDALLLEGMVFSRSKTFT